MRTIPVILGLITQPCPALMSVQCLLVCLRVCVCAYSKKIGLAAFVFHGDILVSEEGSGVWLCLCRRVLYLRIYRCISDAYSQESRTRTQECLKIWHKDCNDHLIHLFNLFFQCHYFSDNSGFANLCFISNEKWNEIVEIINTVDTADGQCV